MYFLVVFGINIFIFHGAPEPLDKDIVESPPPAIHADPNIGLLQSGGECSAGQLSALVAIKDFRLTLGQGPI